MSPGLGGKKQKITTRDRKVKLLLHKCESRMESWKKQPSSSHDHLLRVLPDSARSLSQRQYYMFLVCCCSITKSCLDSLLTACTALRQTSLSFTISRSLLKLMSIESVMSFNHLILHRPLLLPSIFPSISLFQWVGSLHQVAKVLKLQLQCQSFQWIFGVDFF